MRVNRAERTETPLATLPIRLLISFADAPTWFLLAAFANDALKAWASAYLIRRLIPDLTRISGPREFGLFVAVAVILVPAVSALAGGRIPQCPRVSILARLASVVPG
jgi:hypothetical protein